MWKTLENLNGFQKVGIVAETGSKNSVLFGLFGGC